MCKRFVLIIFTLFLTLLSAAEAVSDEQLKTWIGELASRKSSERADAIAKLADSGDARLGPFFEAYRSGSVFLREDEPYIGGDIFTNEDLDEFVTLTSFFSGEPVLDADGTPTQFLVSDLTKVKANRKERKLARSAGFLLGLRSPDDEQRLQAARRCGFPPYQQEALPLLEQMAEEDSSAEIRYTASESFHLIGFGDAAEDWELRSRSAKALGELRSLRGIPLIEEYLKTEPELERGQLSTLENALREMRKHAQHVRVFDNIKFGLSTGSIYILMALGLAIIYGLMGVINMAHGEMMMIGAYTTFVTQQLFGHGPDTPQNHFFLFAIPASFLVAAGVGWVIERLVVRKLYHRPFESLLATVGVSFILIQVVRLIFGDNQSSNSPTWLVGSFNVARDMTLSYNRVFIFVLTVACVLGVQALMKYSSFGLKVRATMQHRDMASCLGIHTRRVYSLTFMLGSGLAGLAGCALTTISGITPNMGQNYIVDSFLIVVIGGVGELLGVICSGLGLGVSVQLLENGGFSPVWAKITILAIVVVFIQFKPAGLFPPKGRNADV